MPPSFCLAICVDDLVWGGSSVFKDILDLFMKGFEVKEWCNAYEKPLRFCGLDVSQFDSGICLSQTA